MAQSRRLPSRLVQVCGHGIMSTSTYHLIYLSYSLLIFPRLVGVLRNVYLQIDIAEFLRRWIGLVWEFYRVSADKRFSHKDPCFVCIDILQFCHQHQGNYYYVRWNTLNLIRDKDIEKHRNSDMTFVFVSNS